MQATRGRLLDTAMAAHRLGLDRDSVGRLFRQGKIGGAFRAGGRWRIFERDLQRYIDTQTPQPRT